MDKKKLLWAAFGLMVLIQLYVPAKWIYEHEKLIRTGTPYKFRLVPRDPGDPFRGNYLTLEYAADSIGVEAPGNWDLGETVYVSFATSKAGYVRLMSVSHHPFEGDIPYFRSEVNAVHHEEELKRGWIELDHPFDRYFLNEKLVEGRHLYSLRDQLAIADEAWARIKVDDGRAVLEEVFIEGKPLREFLKEERPSE